MREHGGKVGGQTLREQASDRPADAPATPGKQSLVQRSMPGTPAEAPPEQAQPAAQAPAMAALPHYSSIRRIFANRVEASAKAASPPAMDAQALATDGRGSGQPVDAGVRKLVEPQLGIALDQVRVHTDERAAADAAKIGARAFAYGTDVVLGAGERPTDVALMAHELTHVAQQSPEPRRQVAVGAQDHPAEREADAVAAAITSGQPATSARIVDDGETPLAGQITRSELMARLHQVAVQTASATIGPTWQAAECAYIDRWFAQHATTPSAQLERLLQRFTGVTVPATANDYLAPAGARLARAIVQWQQGQDVSAEAAAAGVASEVPPATGAPAGTVQAKRAEGEAGSPAALARELGAGQPLDAGGAAQAGDAYGASFSNVRVHTGGVAARMASAQGAAAFAVGEHVAFAAGAYQPNTPHGDALIAHELAHVVQQQQLGPAAVQRKKLDETSHEPAEVEADQAATGFMARVWGGAKTAVRKITEVATRSQLQRCSGNGVPVPSDPFVARLHAKLYATPPDYAGVLGDLAGLNAGRAGDAVIRSGLQTFVTNGKLTPAQAFRAACYQELGPDNRWPLPVKNFADGVDAGKFPSAFPPAGAEALREHCVLRAGGAADGAGNVTVDYRNQFNARFDDPALAALSVDFAPALDSKGPRTPRARRIFTDLYTDARYRVAYDTNTPAGFRGMVDTLVGPEGTNLIASPRLHDLRAQLNGAPVAAPTTAAAPYTAFVATITPLAQALDARDRQEIQRSHAWRLASDAKIAGPVDVKDDLWSVITTSRAAVPVAPAPAGPAVAPPAPPVPNAAQTAFLHSIHITAPASPSNAQLAEHPLTFQVRGAANPGLAVSRKVVVEPAAQVIDGAPDEQPWPNTATAVDQTVHVDPQPTGGAASTVFTAKLTMPPLAAATFAEQHAQVTVFDRRLDWVRAHMQPGLTFIDDNQPTFVAPNATIHYTGKQCPLAITPAFAAGAMNPGINLQMDGVLKRGGVVVQAIPRVGFGAHSASASLLNTILQQPVPPPPVPENWELTVRAYVGAAPAVAHTMVVPFKIAAGAAGNIAADNAILTADTAWLNQPIATAGSLLHHMNALGGHPQAVAQAVASGALKVKACLVRSDSADAVTALGGNPATAVAYAMGAATTPAAAVNTLVAQPGAVGWRWSGAADTVFLNATPVHGGGHRAVAELGELLAHEGTHAADRSSGAPGEWDRYATEFRAYWIEGIGAGQPTAFDPTMSGLGPKAPRARAIFEFLYGSATYPFVKPAYDGNVAGFRERVDNYLFPDGINLTLSGTLTALRTEIETATPVAPAAFAAKKAAVLAKFAGCTPADRTEISHNRDWRDLVEQKFPGMTGAVPPARQQDEIKDALGIPR